MHMLMQQKKTQLAWNRNHIPTQGDKPCTGYVYSLSFGKEISDLRPILTSMSEDQKNAQETTFPNIIPFLWFH